MSAPTLRQFCHDLSQPLTAARGSLELAQQLPADDPARAGFLQDAIEALDRLRVAIEQARAAGRGNSETP